MVGLHESVGSAPAAAYLGWIEVQEAAITDEASSFSGRRYGWATSSASDNVGHRITMSGDFQTDYILFYF